MKQVRTGFTRKVLGPTSFLSVHAAIGFAIGDLLFVRFHVLTTFVFGEGKRRERYIFGINEFSSYGQHVIRFQEQLLRDSQTDAGISISPDLRSQLAMIKARCRVAA